VEVRDFSTHYFLEVPIKYLGRSLLTRREKILNLRHLGRLAKKLVRFDVAVDW
jgi:hypothetical protein